MEVQPCEIQQWKLAEKGKEFHHCLELGKENRMVGAKLEKMRVIPLFAKSMCLLEKEETQKRW